MLCHSKLSLDNYNDSSYTNANDKQAEAEREIEEEAEKDKDKEKGGKINRNGIYKNIIDNDKFDKIVSNLIFTFDDFLVCI